MGGIPGHPCRASHLGCPTRGHPGDLLGGLYRATQPRAVPSGRPSGPLLPGGSIPNGLPGHSSRAVPFRTVQPGRSNAAPFRFPILGAQTVGHPGDLPGGLYRATQPRAVPSGRPNPGAKPERFNPATHAGSPFSATPSGPPNPSGSTRATRPGDLYRGPIVSRMPPPA